LLSYGGVNLSRLTENGDLVWHCYIGDGYSTVAVKGGVREINDGGFIVGFSSEWHINDFYSSALFKISSIGQIE